MGEVRTVEIGIVEVVPPVTILVTVVKMTLVVHVGVGGGRSTKSIATTCAAGKTAAKPTEMRAEACILVERTRSKLQLRLQPKHLYLIRNAEVRDENFTTPVSTEERVLYDFRPLYAHRGLARYQQ